MTRHGNQHIEEIASICPEGSCARGENRNVPGHPRGDKTVFWQTGSVSPKA
jgi:hypothetical protein